MQGAAGPGGQQRGLQQVIKSSRKYIVAALGGLALSIPLATGVASAQPDLSGAVNTTCTYEQVMNAMNAQRPDLAQQFNASPIAQGALRSFLASGPAQRQNTVNQIQANPMAQEYFGPINTIAASCNNY